MRDQTVPVGSDGELTTIDNLMGAAPNTSESDELEVLVTLVVAYEAKRWPDRCSGYNRAIKHVIEARELRQRDLPN